MSGYRPDLAYSVYTLSPELFSAVECSATPLQQYGALYQLISLILTTCLYLVLNAASKRTSTNFHSRPNHKRCLRLRIVSLNWQMARHQLCDWLTDSFITCINESDHFASFKWWRPQRQHCSHWRKRHSLQAHTCTQFPLTLLNIKC